MQKIIHDILTNEDARQPATVETAIVEQTSAGVPWWDE